MGTGVRGKWKAAGPPVCELVSAVTVIRRAGRCAVILPVLDERGMLASHLSELSAQSTQDFTVIVVSPEIKAHEIPGSGGFGIIHLAERAPSGLAAASYCGAKFAVESGFEAVIHADVGCTALSPDLVERLCAAVLESPGTLAFPSKMGAGGDPMVLDWYGAVHSSAHLRAGFAYIPLYFGCQELELRTRLQRSGARARTLGGVSLEHRFSPAPWKDAGRILYSLRNQGVLSIGFSGFLPNALSSISCLAFFDSLGCLASRCRIAAALLCEMAALRMYRCESFHKARIGRGRPSDLARILSSGSRISAISVPRSMGRGASSAARRALASRGIPIRTVGGDGAVFLLRLYAAILSSSICYDSVVLLSRPLLAMNPFGLLAKNLYCIDPEGRPAALLEGRPPAVRAGSFLISIALLSLILPAYLLLSAAAWLRIGRNAAGYGTGCPK